MSVEFTQSRIVTLALSFGICFLTACAPKSSAQYSNLPLDPAQPSGPKPAFMPTQQAPVPGTSPSDEAPKQVDPKPEKAPKNATEPSLPSEKHHIDVPAPKQDAAIANATITCERADACPSAVGMLIVKEAKKLGECTSFLINEDTLLTNSHCIPDEMKEPGSLCGGRIQVFFPKSGVHPEERVSCEKIITAALIGKVGTEGYTLTPDYAVVKLNRAVNRDTFYLNRSGLSDAMKLTAYSVDPQSKQAVIGILRAKTCIARQRSIVAPSFVQTFAPVGSFSDCTIIPGNSGSPAVDETGAVRAIVHATLEEKKAVNDKAQSFKAMAMLTNIACVSIPEEAGVGSGLAHVDCAKSASTEDLVNLAGDQADESKLAPLVEKWRTKAPKTIKFDADRSGTGQQTVVSPQITCLKPGATSPLKLEMPYWGFSVELDPYYRLVLTPDTIDVLSASFEFDAKTLSSKGFVKAKFTGKWKNSGKVDHQDAFGLVACPKAQVQASK